MFFYLLKNNFDILDTMNTFSDPQKIVDQLDLSPELHIADFGSGAGNYVMAIAHKLKGSSTAKVFAVDVQKELLNRIHQQAEQENLSSVHIIWGDIEEENGSRLRHESIDVVIVANTLFQVGEKVSMLKEVRRVLKPGGKLVIVDWSESFGNIGPKENEVISEETAKLLCEEQGFSFDRTLEAGEHHYGFITRKF